MKKISITLILLAALLISAFILFSPKAGNQTVTIFIDEKGFEPNTITINQGDTVTFVNRGKVDHWPASNIHPTHEIYSEFDSKKGIASSESWSFTFDRAGTWKMHDHLFSQLTGTITVTPKTSGESSSLQATVTDEIKKQAETYENIERDSKLIWNNDAALYAYMKKYGATQTFAQLDSLEKQGIGDCHQTAHRAGHFGLSLFGNDVLKECNLSCHSGCYHGATEEYFKLNGNKDLAEGLNTLCAASAGNPFYNHQCLHGLGHGLMAWTSYDLPDALKTCDLLKSGQGSCWTGVFMENIVAGLATNKSDTHITAYKNDDPLYPCNSDAVQPQYKSSCYFLQTSRMMQLYGLDYKKIADGCSAAPTEYRSVCFQSMGRDVSSAYRETPDRSIKECSHAPQAYRIDCLTGAVQDALWDMSGQKTAIKFCTLLTDKVEKTACYNTIIGRMREIANNPEEKQIFCNAIEKDYQHLCF